MESTLVNEISAALLSLDDSVQSGEVFSTIERKVERIMGKKGWIISETVKSEIYRQYNYMIRQKNRRYAAL